MQQGPSTSQDKLTGKIFALLTEYPNHFFTVKELIEDRHIYSSRQQIQRSLEELLRGGLVKVTMKGKETSYQIITPQQKKKPSPTL